MTESSRISHTLPKGYQLEDFEIEEVLGIGGFGITYKARDIHLNRPVAIKEYMPSGMAIRDKEQATVFPASDSHKDDFEWGLDRFRKEAETLVSFRHPNIVSVFRFFRSNGTAYLVMEYQDGKSLSEILGASGTLSEPEIEEILDPLLDGLEDVHEAGFMHRDIKPANLFIRRDGKPVLIDFGAARQALGGHSQALTSIVTAGYAPYEQYESDSVQGPWSDIYALGATLYRAVTGQRPVEAPKRAGCVMRGEPDPNKPASEVVKGKYSARLLSAIDAALNVLEGQRPQSVQEFRNYLKGVPKAEAKTAVTAPTGPGTATEGATLYVGGSAAGPSGVSGPTAATAPPAPP
ncbi:MAG: serine/threonine-protein kinase, partial [Bauldia litoralis]